MNFLGVEGSKSFGDFRVCGFRVELVVSGLAVVMVSGFRACIRQGNTRALWECIRHKRVYMRLNQADQCFGVS